MPKISITGYELLKSAFFGLGLTEKLPKLEKGEEWKWNITCTDPTDKKTYTLELWTEQTEKKTKPTEEEKEEGEPTYTPYSWKDSEA